MPLPHIERWDRTPGPKPAGLKKVNEMEQPRHRLTDWTAQEVACPVLDDLAFERALFQHPKLSIFRRNATTWEVLLMLAAAPDGDGPGLYEVIDAVQTRALGPSALLRFLRDRREDGSIVFTRNSLKQSKWSLALPDDLRQDLLTLMQRRV